MSDMSAMAREGATNLARNCAGIAAGQKVVLVNQTGAAVPETAEIIAEAVSAQGARAQSVWIDGGAGDEKALDAARSADVVIASTLTLDPVAPLAGAQAIVVHNLFHDLNLLGSGHARTHWGFIRAIHAYFDSLLAPGTAFHISSPGGTDLRGKVGALSHRASYREDETPSNVRFFHSQAWPPTATEDADGVISCEYTGGPKRIPCADPVRILFKGNRVQGFEGAAEEVAKFDENLARLEGQFGDASRQLDSFHGGVHPWAEYVEALVGNGCTRNLHFHIGRTTGKSGDYFAAEIGPVSMELDGRPVYVDGKFVILQDQQIRDAAEKFGVAPLLAA